MRTGVLAPGLVIFGRLSIIRTVRRLNIYNIISLNYLNRFRNRLSACRQKIKKRSCTIISTYDCGCVLRAFTGVFREKKKNCISFFSFYISFQYTTRAMGYRLGT